jgi:lysophospholipase L1-like esterase
VLPEETDHMKLTTWLRSLCDRSSAPPARPRTCRPRLEALEERAVPAGLLRLATLGDSLSAPYPPTSPWGTNGDQSWTQQLGQLRAGEVEITNVAVPGATSADVLAGQAGQVADLVAQGKVDFASLIVGANDVFTHLPILAGAGPDAFVQAFVTDVTANIAQTLDVVAKAGDVGLVVGNIPDVAGTPFYQVFIGQQFGALAPEVLQATTAAITQANGQIEALAQHREIPVVDLFAFTRRAAAPLNVGGVQITNPYSPDFLGVTQPRRVGDTWRGMDRRLE